MIAPVEPKTWRWRRWGFMLTLVFAGQLALIFTLSDRAPIRQRPPATAPVLHLTDARSSELMALWDPTLFALPHRQGFSSMALKVRTPSEIRSEPPTEPMEYLELPVQQLGVAFNQFVATNKFGGPPARPEVAPELGLPTLISRPAASAASTVHVEGQLAQRRLLTPVTVPPWPHTEILANTVIQIGVDGDGHTVSVGAVLSSSGSKEADQQALKLARATRFEPVKVYGPGRTSNQSESRTWGTLIFEWQTIPLPATNNAPVPPQP